MAAIKFFKVTELPETLAENALYYVKDEGVSVELYLTDGEGVPSPVSPSGLTLIDLITEALGSDEWFSSAGTNLATDRGASSVTVTSSSGDNAAIPAATDELAGVLSAADKAKLDTVEEGAEPNLTPAQIIAALDTYLDSDEWRGPAENGASIIGKIDDELGYGEWKTPPRSPEDIVDAVNEALDSTDWQTGAASFVGTNLGRVVGGSSVEITSNTGSNALIEAADASNAGVMTASDKSKLDGIEPGATGDMTPEEIAAAVNAYIGNTSWQGEGPGNSQTNPTVRVATTDPINIPTALNDGDMIDGVELENGDLVLVKDQSNAIQNGIYVVGVSPQRHANFDTFAELAGAIVTIQEGGQASQIWLCVSPSGGEIGTDPVEFIQTSITPTNLSTSRNANEVVINSSTGSGAPVPAASTSQAGVMTAADKTKLDNLVVDATIGLSRTAGNVTLTLSGEDTVIPAADASNAGAMTAAQAAKLAGVAAGAQVNVPTNLGASRSSTAVTVTSSNGNNVQLQAATDELAGVMTATQAAKLASIEAGAQVNLTPAQIVAAVNSALGGDAWQEGGSSGGGGSGGGNVDGFVAAKTSGNQQLTSTLSKVTFNSVPLNPGSKYVAGTSRWTPGVSGPVFVGASVRIQNHTSSGGSGQLQIRKNGVAIGHWNEQGNISMPSFNVGLIDVCSPGDYYEVFAFSSAGSGPGGTQYGNVLSGIENARFFGQVLGGGGGGGAEPTDITISRTETQAVIESSTGSNGTLGAASTTEAGVMSASDKEKLDGITAGAQPNPSNEAIVAAVNAHLDSTAWQAGPQNASQVPVDDSSFENIEGETVQEILADIDEKITSGEVGSAEDVSFDNGGTNLASTNVQGALAELDGEVSGLVSDLDNLTAEDVGFDPGESDLESENTQDAILEVYGAIADGETNIQVTQYDNRVEVGSSTGDADDIGPATAEFAGVMTPEMHDKLAGIAEGAEVNPSTAAIISSINDQLGGTNWQSGGGEAGASVRVTAVATSDLVIATALNPSDVIDGVTLEDGDLVLVVGQTALSQNGIYTVGATPERTPGLNLAEDLSGLQVSVISGNVYGGSVWLCVNEPSSNPNAPKSFERLDNYLDRLTVRVATTANIGSLAASLNPGDVVDGVTLVLGDLVLVKDQEDAEENGIYRIVPVDEARAWQFSKYDDHPGATLTVRQGTVNGGSTWRCTSQRGGTLGTTALVFSRLNTDVTDLGVETDVDEVTITSSTGAEAVIPAATYEEAGVMSADDKSKLDAINIEDLLTVSGEGQGPITGGFAIEPKELGSVSSGFVDIDVSARGLQTLVNNGEFVLRPGTASGVAGIYLINGASAGEVAITNWTGVFGDELDEDEGSIFRLGVEICGPISNLFIRKVN